MYIIVLSEHETTIGSEIMDIENKLAEFKKLGEQSKIAQKKGWEETCILLHSQMADIVMELKPVEDKVLFQHPEYAGLFHALESVYYPKKGE